MKEKKKQNIATIYLTDEEREIWDYISAHKVKIGFRSMGKLAFFSMLSNPAIRGILRKSDLAEKAGILGSDYDNQDRNPEKG